MAKRRNLLQDIETQGVASASFNYFSAFSPRLEETEALLLPDALPRLLAPQSGADCAKAVVICLHGFSGMPYELDPGLAAIAQAGLTAAAPLLPRHGYRDSATQHREFALLNRDELLAAARQEIAIARQSYDHVGLMGFSMGGAIALTLAAEGLVDACAAIAPALRLPLKAEILIPLLGWADFEIDARSTETFYFPKYEFHHARSLRAIWRLAALARQGLSEIRCPLQVIHSQMDRTIPARIVDLIERQVPVPVETFWFNESGHIMLRDRDQKAVALALTEFMQRQLCSGSSCQERPPN